MRKLSQTIAFISVTIFLFQIISIKNVCAQQDQTTEDEVELRKEALNIFIDDEGLDMNYVREQIPYGNFVRDTRLADVYVRETRESAGSGGSKYTYMFEGQNEFANMNDTLTYSSSPDDTYDETRAGRTNMLKMGLIRYVARTPLYSEVQITSTEGSQRPEVEAVDKWNNWVFEVRASPRWSDESRRKSTEISGSFNATKITPELKIELDASINREKNQNKLFNRDEEMYEWYVSHRNSSSFRSLVVWSLGDHWSAGGRVNASRSTYSNYDSRFEFEPAIEFNAYPYAESTHHQLRMLYSIGVALNNYADTTIYLKKEETLVQQSLDIAFRVQEKWGSANFSVEASNYMHDFSKNRFEIGGNISYRITTGLSVNAGASYAWIHNQLSLEKGDATVEEILLGLVQLPTTNSFDANFGFSYTFGSIYNNVVNPRFGGGGGGGGGRGYY